MRVLVTGAAGQVATDFALVCRKAGDDVAALTHRELDVTDRDAVLGAITSLRPDVVVNTAAWTDVDACEGEPARAFAANALGVRWLSDACRRSGSRLVQLSTDYVFDGAKTEPYTEWDDPGPLSVYGRSKLAGEREAGPDATIVRTSWVCGEHGANVLKTVLRLAQERDELAFVADQRSCPTFTSDLAPMIRRLALDRRPGVHHVTNQGAVSRYELARAIVEAAGRDPDMVRPIATSALVPPRPALRPVSSVLDNAVLRASGLPLLPDFRESLIQVVRRLGEVAPPA